MFQMHPFDEEWDAVECKEVKRIVNKIKKINRIII